MTSNSSYYLITYLNEGFRRKQSLIVDLARKSNREDISTYLFRRLDYDLNPLVEDGKEQYIFLDSKKIYRMENIFVKKSSNYKEIIKT